MLEPYVLKGTSTVLRGERDGDIPDLPDYTYSGFISGIGVGVDFLIKDDGKIYCLGYWLDKQYGPGRTFYTNDPEYKDKLPEWMGDSPSDLLFVYKDV